MAFVAPLIGAAIGGIATTAIGQAVIGVGLSIGANYLTRRKKPQKSSSPRGMSLSLRVESNEFREVILGQAATAGSLKYHNTYGPNGNDYLQLVFVLADHECDGLAGMFVDGKPVSFGAEVTSGDATGLTVNQFPGVMWVKFYSGAWGQSADADLVAQNNDWSSDYRGRGLCYVRVTLKYNAELYPNGIPNFLFVLRGAKVYDWRKDSTVGGSGSHRWGQPETYEYTNNPTVCLYNWMRGIYVNGERLAGMNAPASSLPLADWTAAANACDETVNLKSGGTEKRYRMGGVIPVDTDNSTVVSEILASMAGELVDSGGVFRPLAGVAQASVMTITDDDLTGDETVEIVPKLSRGTLINAVFGTFMDPAQAYESTALPPRISPDDEAADGGIRLEDHYNLGFVFSGTQGQRILEILRRKGRHQRRVSIKLRSRFAVLEAGDWITWNSERYGFSGVKFEVENAALNRDLTVTLDLRETSETIFAWSPSTDELDPANPATVSAGGSTFTTVQGLALTSVEIEAFGSAKRPGLRITWDPIDDETVVGLDLEYRKVGDTVALARPIIDLSANEYTWLDGVQGEIEYEARVRPVVQPERAVSWTGWVSTESNTPAHVVGVAAIANAVPPDTITNEMLSEQTRREIELVTAKEDAQGAVAERMARLNDKIVEVSQAVAALQHGSVETGAFVRTQEVIRQTQTESLARQITQVQAQVEDDVASAIQQLEATVFDPEDGLPSKASASALTALSVTVDDHTNAISEIMEVDSEGNSRWFIGATANGTVAYFISADGTKTASEITLGAGAIRFVDPNGGDPIHLASVETVGGQARLVLNGEMIADAIKAGHVQAITLDSISANLGTITAGIIRAEDNSVIWDLVNQRQYRPDGTMEIDWKNKRFRMGS